jgi:DNA-binding GntR family transcriptional regulator
LREALEAFAVEKAIGNLSRDALDELSKKLHRYGDDVEKRFTRDRLLYDRDLHLEIARISGNATLVKTLAQLFERIILKRHTDGLYDRLRGALAHQEHLSLYQAMQERNVGQAVAIIRTHIRAGKENVVADLKRRQEMRESRGNGTVI